MASGRVCHVSTTRQWDGNIGDEDKAACELKYGAAVRAGDRQAINDGASGEVVMLRRSGWVRNVPKG